MSSFVKALGLALHSGPPRIACCPHCPGEVPLISTMYFVGAEFYCLDCGAKIGFVDPKPAEATPELDAETERRKREWDVHVLHATDQEVQAWLAQRKTKGAPVNDAKEIEAKRKELAEALEEEADAASRAALLVQELEDAAVDVSDITERFV